MLTFPCGFWGMSLGHSTVTCGDRPVVCWWGGRGTGRKDREDAQGPVSLLGVRTGLGLERDWSGPAEQDETASSL